MDKRPERLTEQFVKAVTAPGRYGEGRGGLGLSLIVRERVGDGRTKSFTQRLTINGQITNVGLGRWPLVRVAEARIAALENLRAVDRGEDPRRKAKNVVTFRHGMEAAIDLKRPTWKGSGSEEAWRYTLEGYAGRLMERPVSSITSADVMAVLRPIWSTKPESTEGHGWTA